MVIEYLLCFKKINFILVAQVSGSQILRPPRTLSCSQKLLRKSKNLCMQSYYILIFMMLEIDNFLKNYVNLFEDSNNKLSDQHTFSVKGQTVNIFGFMNHKVSCNYSTLLLQCQSSHGQYVMSVLHVKTFSKIMHQSCKKLLFSTVMQSFQILTHFIIQYFKNHIYGSHHLSHHKNLKLLRRYQIHSSRYRFSNILFFA